jgi:hypothetical protein
MAGSESELQVAVGGDKNSVDLPLCIEQSNYLFRQCNEEGHFRRFSQTLSPLREIEILQVLDKLMKLNLIALK